jgi:Putative lumazine-binding
MEQIKKIIELFIQGGDNSDVNLLEKVLHPKYQNIQDGFFAEKGIFVISKSEYIELVNNKTFGGKPRTIKFVSLEQAGNMAIAKVELVRPALKFISTIICVCENEEWQVINNTPTIEALEK